MVKLSYIRYYVIFFFMVLLIGCKREAPTSPKEIPKGVFIQKIAFANFDSLYSPKIAVGDLYNDSGTFRLYNVNKLVNGESPCLSKDQSWIAYISYGNNLTLRKINVNGTGDSEILITPSDLTPQLVQISPDNSTLSVLAGGYFTGTSVGIIPAAGGVFKVIYNQGWSNTDWSQDSKTIFFSWPDMQNQLGHNVPPLAKKYIASINVDGAGMKFISDTADGLSDDMEPNISPDGKSIVFDSFRSHSEGVFPEVFSMDINGNNVLKLTEAKISSKNGNHYDYYSMDNSPQWLKDGQHIIFQREYDQYDYNIMQYKYSYDLYIVNKDGTGLQNLTNNGKSTLYKK